ncbi:hypothetical protein BCIN_01g07010 [Botrytis cinerea B05.10]|uniref:Uncharacterized protein n=3 Tax=Botryotinia fuckeliana TaxID=40559 RepID=A0A384J663_BOTFB|nr:hypothetical protein BCIN_01g07010 [Botrytis cinerea B05.10]ATZ46023.1 hypothetical protein BCIN_01g07010 [Botrytis cinerea B05.10]CCD45721.1 hypothetical protein BofuT4_P047390.1 [Botrytis cinerea T4]
MCKELYVYHKSCGGDGIKPCICDKSCPYYEPYFASTCNSTWLRGDDNSTCKRCPHRAMDDERDKTGQIMPVVACHSCPGHEGHMKGADLPKANPSHRSAISKRAIEIKNQFERSNIPARPSSVKTAGASLARGPEFAEYLGKVLAQKM